MTITEVYSKIEYAVQVEPIEDVDFKSLTKTDIHLYGKRKRTLAFGNYVLLEAMKFWV